MYVETQISGSRASNNPFDRSGPTVASLAHGRASHRDKLPSPSLLHWARAVNGTLDANESAFAAITKSQYLWHMSTPAILSNPDIMGGTPCLAGTRVPFQTLLDYLEGGEKLDEFLIDFPSVARELAVSALQQAGELALAKARAA